MRTTILLTLPITLSLGLQGHATAQAAGITIDNQTNVEVNVEPEFGEVNYGADTDTNDVSEGQDQINGNQSLELFADVLNGLAPGDSGPSIMEAAGSITDSFNITANATNTLMRGQVWVEGKVSAILDGAVGTASSAAKAKTDMDYANQSLSAAEEAYVAIAAGQPNTIGMSCEYIGIEMTYTLASGQRQGNVFSDIDVGLTKPANQAVVSMMRHGSANWLTTMGHAGAKWSAETAAKVTVTLPAGGGAPPAGTENG